jgi:hypothetical protein
MKHLEGFEEFGYHSEISEERYKTNKPKKTSEDIGSHKCHKCKSKTNKPHYQHTLKEIPRLF